MRLLRTKFTKWLVLLVIFITLCLLMNVYLSPQKHNGDEGCMVEYMTSTPQGKRDKKVIFYMGDLWKGMSEILQFDGCEFFNCIYQTCDDISYTSDADALIFAHDSKHVTLTLPKHVRQHQQWLVYGVESPAFKRYRWNEALNDFDGTLTYLHDSYPGVFAYGKTLPRKPTDALETINFAEGKVKGAFAYVSNCDSVGYHRLNTMKELSKYVEVDIFGDCTGRKPCPNRFDAECEAKLHAKYRFYLAFENSLCKEYITEKFWRGLHSDGYFIPVALGGLAVSEYSRVAPPNSFIHAYNFTSMQQLGQHMTELMTDDESFNKYHAWRKDYQISMLAQKPEICNICKAVNRPELLASTHHRQFADEFNDPNNCRKFL